MRLLGLHATTADARERCVHAGEIMGAGPARVGEEKESVGIKRNYPKNIKE